MKKALKKLKSRAGFTMSELLIATMIVFIMAGGVAAGVSASVRSYNESVTYSEERILLSTLSEAVMSELRYAKEIQNDGTFTSDSYGPGVMFGVSDGKITIGPDGAGALLIGSGSYSNDTLEAEIKCSYAAGTGTYSVTLSVTVGSSGSPQTKTFNIRPLINQVGT